MRLVKPLRLSLLHRTYEDAGRHQLVVAVIAYVSLSRTGVLLPEMALWPMLGEELGKDGVFDEAMPKPAGELLVWGSCYAPSGSKRTVSDVRVRLGSIDKRLFVVGDRVWSGSKPTDPAPFERLPIDWPHAFGGEGFRTNPLGKGAVVTDGPAGRVRPLPNVEDPRRVVASPGDTPEPAGLRPLDLTWPQRMQHAGTYGAEWLETRFPGLPADFDWRFQHVAPPDQRITGFFRGDEPFVIENMHPDKPTLEGALPGLLARCFLLRSGKTTPDELPLSLDTVWLFPHRERGVLVFRGRTPVPDEDASDVDAMLLAADYAKAPRSADHYAEVLARRLDRERGWLHALRDSELVPPPPPDVPTMPDDKISDMEDLLRRDGYVEANLRRRVEGDLEELREHLRAHGVDPDAHVPKELPAAMPSPTLDELPALYEDGLAKAEAARDRGMAELAKAQADARRLCAAQGLDYDAIVEKNRRAAGGPPKFSAVQELQRLRDLAELGRNAGAPVPEVDKLADPELPGKLRDLEAALKDTYRKFGHKFPAAYPREGQEASDLRDEVIRCREARVPLADRDLTGVDLRGLDLDGANLAGAFLEAARFEGASLRGARLAGAVLVRASLAGVDLSRADLSGANLGEATLEGARLDEANLRGATLADVDGVRASLRGAVLDEAELSGADLADADLTGASLRSVIWVSPRLCGASLEGASLAKASLIEPDLEDANLAGADLRGTLLLDARAPRARLRGATCDELRVVRSKPEAISEFSGADLHGASLRGANLRGARLVDCDLGGATLEGADLSEANLTRAKLVGVKGRECRLVKADLTDADMRGAELLFALATRAQVGGADLRWANLFRADVTRWRGHGSTRLQGAYVRQARMTTRGTR